MSDWKAGILSWFKMRSRLKDILADKIDPSKLRSLYRSYDIVGDMTITRVQKLLEHRVRDRADAVMRINKHISAVIHQGSPLSGDYRLPGLIWVAGEKRVETVRKEYRCLFKVDLERCYFSPRLSYERRRTSQLVGRDEVVVNTFSGVGCYSVLIARRFGAMKVYPVDVNSAAVEYQRENVSLNQVEDIVEPILQDATETIKARLRYVADRVLMPLPEKAFEYLDYAIMALKPREGWVHYYDSVRAGRDEKSVEKAEDMVSRKMAYLGLEFEVSLGRVVRKVGPRRFQVVLDMLVRKESL